MDTTPSTEFLALQEALAGRYSLEREIGRGGMGIVFLAQEVRLDRPVALKLLPPDYSARPALRERFLREARTAAKLSHPHIVPIHAVDEVEDFVFFAMAYVEGRTLGQRIRERGPVPPREAARILREVSWALGYAHAQGVVHRDVKPDNILLEEGTGRALVTDFGIAHVGSTTGLTESNEVVGTAEYMSPEQASGEPVDERSDIYALGIVAHYMLSGALPFEGETVAATLAKQITQTAPPLGTVAPAVPRGLAEAVDRCLEKDPDARFADAEELAEVMAGIVNARRQVPATLRAFVSEQRDRLPGASLVLFLAFYFLGISAFAAVGGAPFLLTLVMAVLGVLMGVAPGWMLVRMAREFLRMGHGHDDLLLAFKAEIESRREELASQFAVQPSWYDRLSVLATWGGLAVAALGTGAMFLVESAGGMLASGLAVGFGGLASLAAGPFAATGFKAKRRVPGERLMRFWDSRLGRAVFRLAGMGLPALPAASGAGYRPTEIAIGLAADHLFVGLPKDLKEQFRELPSIVDTLEAHAEQMRARIKSLEAVMSDVRSAPESSRLDAADGGPGMGARRDAVTDDIRAAREAAEERLAQVVRALESIRLELLRMHAGVGSPDGMTQDLGSAKELSQDLERLVQGSREVDELLGIATPRPPEDTPTPQPA